MAEEEQTETKSEGIENLKVLENIDVDILSYSLYVPVVS